MLKAVVITVIEAPTPGAADGLPKLAQFSVVLGTGQVNPVLEQVEVHRQARLMHAVGTAVGLFNADVPVDARVPVGVAKREFIPLLVRELDQQADHAREEPLFLAKCFCHVSRSRSRRKG